MKAVAPFVWLFNLIEMFDRFLRRPQKPAPEPEIAPIFENDARETVRELEEGKVAVMEEQDDGSFVPVWQKKPAEPEIKAPNGICIRKTVHFRSRTGRYLAAKVLGYSWEDPRYLVLSRNGGPPFRRRLCS